jgi:Ala-tRNA(Pro) deacylase
MPATREQLFARFDELGIEVVTREHPPVYTVDEARALRGDIPGGHCKNLFLKDKKGQLWMVVALEDARVDLKTLPDRIGAARISFGKPDLLLEILGVEPGSVTPFALINDSNCAVNVVLHGAMMRCELVSYHPLENTATTTLTPDQLLKFIRSCGHEPAIVEIDE